MIPAPWYYEVSPSPVDTREGVRPSGLHVWTDQPDDERVNRGVITAVGSALEHDDEWTASIGDVVYYLHGVRVGESELVLATYNNILAWE